MGRLDRKIAIVTGGASGIGAATSRALVAQGARVVVADVADRQGAALAADVGEHAVFQHLDVTDEAAWCRVVRYTEETFGVLNVLVNGAGVTGPHTLVNHPRQLWEHILEVNLTGPFLGLSTAAEALARSAPASVINVSSYAGLNGVSPSHGYTASKHGLTGLTKSAAREFAPLGIRVNSIHPGGVATPFIGAAAEQARTTGLNTLQRLARPEEIAALIVFLASDESSYCTGSQFVADGGLSTGMSLP
ncbi:MAG: SDR family NAD(P)-dependent oxidoreductase [Mycobacterium sp.]